MNALTTGHTLRGQQLSQHSIPLEMWVLWRAKVTTSLYLYLTERWWLFLVRHRVFQGSLEFALLLRLVLKLSWSSCLHFPRVEIITCSTTCSPGCPRICYSPLFIPQLPKCWNYKQVLRHPAKVALVKGYQKQELRRVKGSWKVGEGNV